MIFLKVQGETRKSTNEQWQKIVCFVAYADPAHYRKIVEDSFQYHLRLDLDYMKMNHPDHFSEPHNIGRAILLYHYFRDKHFFFKDHHWEYVNFEAMPKRKPDEEEEGYKLWVEFGYA